MNYPPSDQYIPPAELAVADYADDMEAEEESVTERELAEDAQYEYFYFFI